MALGAVRYLLASAECSQDQDLSNEVRVRDGDRVCDSDSRSLHPFGPSPYWPANTSYIAGSMAWLIYDDVFGDAYQRRVDLIYFRQSNPVGIVCSTSVSTRARRLP
jgi:hypothetical protein